MNQYLVSAAVAAIFAAVSSGAMAESPAVPQDIDPAVAPHWDFVIVNQEWLAEDGITTEILLGEAFIKSRCASEGNLESMIDAAYALYEGDYPDHELDIICFWEKGKLLPVALKPVPLVS